MKCFLKRKKYFKQVFCSEVSVFTALAVSGKFHDVVYNEVRQHQLMANTTCLEDWPHCMCDNSTLWLPACKFVVLDKAWRFYINCISPKQNENADRLSAHFLRQCDVLVLKNKIGSQHCRTEQENFVVVHSESWQRHVVAANTVW